MIKDWQLGLVAIAVELILNGKGYLFAINLHGFHLSLRIALWAVVMVVSAICLINKRNWQELAGLWRKKQFWPIMAIAVLVIWGIAQGFINHHDFGNLFFDANNWIFGLTILPVLFWRKAPKYSAPILLAALSALSVITIWLLYAFSHDFGGANYVTYAWVRDSGLGEITLMPAGFYRIFIQSQLYLLPLFFGAFLFWGRARRTQWLALSAATLALAPMVISLSRSFWVGLAIGWVAWVLLAYYKQRQSAKEIIVQIGLMLAALVISVVLLVTAVKLPWPQAQSDVSARMLAERATAINSEAGASSRWALLPKLWQAINRQPLIGQGFGATVTYHSSDPRVLESNPNGDYTTYAFEWGWLELWLKMGIGAVLAFVALFYSLSRGLIKQNTSLSLSLAVAIICLAAVNVFSPYLNHPLGLGLIMLAVLTMKQGLGSSALAKNTKI
ncbi:MAG: O-antigen ligase family protein [Candidatus Falkowbacteria bacterium]